MRFCSKIVLGVTGTFAACVVGFVGMWYVDSSRQALLDCISDYLQEHYQVEVRVRGVNKSLTRINEIFVRRSDGMEVLISDIAISQRSLLTPISICVEKLSFTVSNAKGSSEVSPKEVLPTVQLVKRYIENLQIKHGYLHFANNQTYCLNNLQYSSMSNKDFISGSIGEDKLFKIDINWNESGKIYVENMWGVSGVLSINNLNSDLVTCDLSAKNEDFEITASGVVLNCYDSVTVNDISVKYDNRIYKGSGVITQKYVQLTSQLDLTGPDFISLLQNVKAHVVAKYYFDGKGQADVTLKNDQECIGKLQGLYNNDRLDVYGDVSKIKLYGYRFDKINCSVKNFQDIELVVTGDDMKISSSMHLGKNLLVKSAALISSKGVINTLSPFYVDDDLKCEINFDISQLNLFNGFAPLEGSGSGSLVYKKGKLLGNAKFSKIEYNKQVAIYDMKISSNLQGADCSADTVNLSDLSLKRFRLNIADKCLKISSSVNDRGSLEIDGNYCEGVGVSDINGYISVPNAKLSIKDGTLDFINKIYEVKCFLLGKKKQSCGSASIAWSQQKCDLSFDKFQLTKLAEIYGRSDFKLVIDGKAQLRSHNGVFIGNGQFTCHSSMFGPNALSIGVDVSKNDAKMKLNIKEKTDFLTADVTLPVSISASGDFINKPGRLGCRIFGKMPLEKLFKQTDQLDLKGNLDCNVSISGSIDNPITTGAVKLSNAYIAAGDLVLKNGNISLVGKGDRIIVSDSYFVDDDKHKAVISGEGRVFFKNWIPDIKTALQLQFSNFRLFDSETMKIVIDGRGQMTGPISNLKLTGKIAVPKCEIHNDSTDDNSKSEIEFENLVYPGQASNADGGGDVFEYQIDLHCPKVQFIGDFFNVDLGGDLVLSSYLKRATLIGDLQVKKGRLNLFGKRMIFTNGKVTFLKEFPFNPKAELVCRRSFGDMTVQLHIRNTPADGLKVQLSSNPSYSEDVILSTMMFGKEMKYLSIGEAAQLAHALASLNKRGYKLSILNAIQDFGLVDSISFSTSTADSSDLYTNTQSSASETNINVSAGKYIHDKIYVSVNKKDEETTFDIDVTLSPTVSLKANTAGEVGVSWKYRY